MSVYYGQMAIIPKGTWSPEGDYKVGNLVEWDGSSYVAKVMPPVGTPPTDTNYWQVSATGTTKATADTPGVVKPDGITTKVGEGAALSVVTAGQDKPGIVKGSSDIKVGGDGALSVDTNFEQAMELANIIAGEAVAQILGKVSAAIAATMALDQNALLKSMLTSIDVNDEDKVPNMALIHTMINRIGMDASLAEGLLNLTHGLNSVAQEIDRVNSNLGIAGIKIYSDANIEKLNKIKLATSTTSQIYAALPDGSVAFFRYDASSAIMTEMGNSNGGAVLLYKNNSWRGFGYATCVQSGSDFARSAQISAQNILRWVKISGTIITN